MVDVFLQSPAVFAERCNCLRLVDSSQFTWTWSPVRHQPPLPSNAIAHQLAPASSCLCQLRLRIYINYDFCALKTVGACRLVEHLSFQVPAEILDLILQARNVEYRVELLSTQFVGGASPSVVPTMQNVLFFKFSWNYEYKPASFTRVYCFCIQR